LLQAFVGFAIDVYFLLASSRVNRWAIGRSSAVLAAGGKTLRMAIGIARDWTDRKFTQPPEYQSVISSHLIRSFVTYLTEIPKTAGDDAAQFAIHVSILFFVTL
jgi:hypothetical protein